MCTVTFFPLPEQKFAITSNRDEKIIRPTSVPVVEKVNGLSILFPKDHMKGGSWIAAAENGRSVCLLNGAFEPHVRKSVYRKSRGMVVLESFSFKNPVEFSNTYDFEGIEPFTMIISSIEKNTVKLFECRWDENKIHLLEIDPEHPHIWFSAPLYTKSMQIERLSYFNNWNREAVTAEKKILDFHFARKEEGSDFDIIMKGKYGLQTVSVTQVIMMPEKIKMHYFDLLQHQESEHLIKIQTP